MLFHSPFASDVGFAVAQPRDAAGVALHPEETALVPERAVDSARLTFTLGRIAAHEAAKSCGAPASDPILRCSDRSPLWPPGFTGSISHSARADFALAIAAVGSLGTYAGIGLDVENLQRSVDERLIKRVCTPAELAWCLETPDERSSRALRIFSAKECLFKAFNGIFPQGRTFQGAELRFDPVNHVFEATIRPFVSSRYPENSRHWVSTQIQDDFVLHATALHAEANPGRWEPSFRSESQ